MDIDKLDRSLFNLERMRGGGAVADPRREVKRNPNLCLVKLNSRYLSDITVGYCMRRVPAKNRLCPYTLPLRYRTKSENSETQEIIERQIRHILETGTDPVDIVPQTKRCSSTENLNLIPKPSRSESSNEVEGVSTQIQKLKVDE